jgi:hypothetical protein
VEKINVLSDSIDHLKTELAAGPTEADRDEIVALMKVMKAIRVSILEREDGVSLHNSDA